MSEAENSKDSEETIQLDQFLKLADLVGSGGEAKHVIRSGVVLVNGKEETRRGRKLKHGDVVTFSGEEYVIEATSDE
ncbi:MAG: RNA-binding S4 domain-containing protein [Fuerstiella sp.]